jgi:hypothetical protein
MRTDAQISITQALFFYSHLSMAELLHIVAREYNYPQLTEEVLREVSDKEFSSTDRKGPTSVSAFLVRIAELLPEVVMKQMTSLAKLVDNEVLDDHHNLDGSRTDLSIVVHSANGYDRRLRTDGHYDQQANRRRPT